MMLIARRLRTGELVALLCAISCLLTSVASARRFNLFDPLFADDDSDAHTVSAGSNNSPQGSNNDNNNNNNKRILEIRNKNVRSGGQHLPPAFGDDDDGFGYASSLATTGRATTSTTRSSQSLAPKRIESSIAGWSTQVPSSAAAAASAAAASTNIKRHLTSAPTGLNELDRTVAATARPSFTVAKRQMTEKPRHWSALESYYETLRKSSQSASSAYGQPAPFRYYPSGNSDTDQVDQKLIDELLTNRRYQPIYAGGPAEQQANPSYKIQDSRPFFLQPAQPVVAAGKTNTWLFPGVDQASSYQSPSQQQQQQQLQRLSDLLNNSKISYLPDRIINMGGGAPQTIAQQPSYGSKNSPSDSSQRPIEVNLLSAPIRQHSPHVQQPLDYFEQFPIDQLLRPAPQPAAATGDAQKQASLQRALEAMLIQQQDARVRHQLETLGPLVDRHRFQELIQQENYCGPRNSILGGVDVNRLNLGSASSDPLTASRLRDLVAAASPGEYPSHMGLYNGTEPGDDNFLCGATWIHDRFALTLASCIPRKLASSSKIEPILSVRAGEWRLLRAANSTVLNQLKPQVSFTRRIAHVHPFPRYVSNSSEHNLALLEWLEPTNYLQHYSFISPACPIQGRQLLPATSACYTPIRNLTLSEYFDAEGEGETKIRKQIGIHETPVKLLNDDTDCKRETQLDLFNYQHPNYICSSDVKRTPWRAKLNQTDNFGSGIYCNDAGRLSLVSIVHPLHLGSASQFGYMDLTYYKPWMQGVISSSQSTHAHW